jgi:hypothetical protein
MMCCEKLGTNSSYGNKDFFKYEQPKRKSKQYLSIVIHRKSDSLGDYLSEAHGE